MKIKDSVFYEAINRFPGTLLLDHWKESRELALAKAKEKNEPELVKEIESKLTGEAWVVYSLRKFAQDSLPEDYKRNK